MPIALGWKTNDMYRNSKHTILFPLILAVGIILGILLGQFVGRNRAESQLKQLISRTGLMNRNKIMQTCMLVEHQYVDSISMDSLSEVVIPLMMKELDPHSVYALPKLFGAEMFF